MGDDGMKGWEEDIGKYNEEALDLHQTRFTSLPVNAPSEKVESCKELGLWDQGAGTEDAPR